MKNTLALAVILLGGMLIYGGYKDYSFADTIRYFTGQKLVGKKDLKVLPPQSPAKPESPTNPPGFPKSVTPGPGGTSS